MSERKFVVDSKGETTVEEGRGVTDILPQWPRTRDELIRERALTAAQVQYGVVTFTAAETIARAKKFEKYLRGQA